MNSPEDIRAYREAERAELFQSFLWLSQTVVTPSLLILILWRVW
jgi:hypothetical protein